MSQFVSWINLNGANYFLTDRDLRGRRFNEYKRYNKAWLDDITGHGAIRFFYPELGAVYGSECTCSFFKSPRNFPVSLVEAVKALQMTRFDSIDAALTSRALDRYLRIEQPLKAEYNRIKNTADCKFRDRQRSVMCGGDKFSIGYYQSCLDDYLLEEREAYSIYLDSKLKIFWDIFSDPKNRRKDWR